MAGGSARMVGVAAAAVLFVGQSAVAQTLWNGADLGMTPAEVRGVFPQAAHGVPIVDGDHMVLKVPSLRAGGQDATAYFDFRRDRLRRVELLLTPERPGGAVDADRVGVQLSSKYGPPIGCDPGRQKCEWRSGGIEITLADAQSEEGERVHVLYEATPEFSEAAPEAMRPPRPW